jgi:cell division protein FtsL
MTDIDKDLQKTIDDHLKRLSNRYKTNIKVFNATHIGHISLSVVFLLSILLPFFYLQIEKSRTNTEIKRLNREISRQEQRSATYARAMRGLKELYEAVENTPKPLTAYIDALKTEAAGGPAARLPAGLEGDPSACGSSGDLEPWMTCRISQFMRLSYENYRVVLEKEIAAPLAGLDIGEFEQWRADLQSGIQRLVGIYQEEVSANPVYWKTFDENSPLYRTMVDQAHRFRTDHSFEEMDRWMAQALADRQNDAEQLYQKQEQIKKREEELGKTLKNIKTRFGKIGMDLSDAILIAPIIFALLFLVAVINLSESIRLRKSFHRLFQAKDPQKAFITDAQIALAMPLWVDPLDPPPKRKLRLAILTTPAAASVLAVLVVLSCRSIPDAFPGMTTVSYWKYGVYYLIAAGLYIYGYRRLNREIENYQLQREEEDGEGD